MIKRLRRLFRRKPKGYRFPNGIPSVPIYVTADAPGRELKVEAGRTLYVFHVPAGVTVRLWDRDLNLLWSEGPPE